MYKDITISLVFMRFSSIGNEIKRIKDGYVVQVETIHLKPSSDLCQETRPKQILCQESLRRILKCKWEWLIPRDHSAVQERNLQSLDTVSRKYGSTRNCVNDFHFKSELLKPHIFD